VSPDIEDTENGIIDSNDFNNKLFLNVNNSDLSIESLENFNDL